MVKEVSDEAVTKIVFGQIYLNLANFFRRLNALKRSKTSFEFVFLLYQEVS